MPGENGNKLGRGSRSRGSEKEAMSSLQQFDKSSVQEDNWGFEDDPRVELQLHSSWTPNWGLFGT